MASAIGTMVISIVSIWLFTSQSTSVEYEDSRTDESDLQLMIDAVATSLADARPTALCLNPDPNGSSLVTASCTTVGEHWGYTPSPSNNSDYVPGSPFKEASATGICYYGLPDGTSPDPASPKTPDGFCIDEDSGQLRVRTFASSASTYLAAADPSSYNWTSSVPGRALGTVDNIEFKYYDWTGKMISATGTTCTVYSSCMAVSDLDDIELISITLERGSGTDVISKKTTVPVKVDNLLPNVPESWTVAAGSTGELVLTWAAPLANGSSAVTEYRAQWRTGTDTWDSPTGESDLLVSSLSSLTTTISSLTAGSHDARIAAKNSEGIGPWSAVKAATVP